MNVNHDFTMFIKRGIMDDSFLVVDNELGYPWQARSGKAAHDRL